MAGDNGTVGALRFYEIALSRLGRSQANADSFKKHNHEDNRQTVQKGKTTRRLAGGAGRYRRKAIMNKSVWKNGREAETGSGSARRSGGRGPSKAVWFPLTFAFKVRIRKLLITGSVLFRYKQFLIL